MQAPYHRSGAWIAVLAAIPLLFLSDCGQLASIGGAPSPLNGVDHVDPALNLTREDYRHITAPKAGSPAALTISQDAPPVPKLAEILAAPRPPKIGETQLVSIAVTDDVPLKDVLLELAKLADVDIELDAGITGGVEFIAKDKPFNEVIDRISDLAGLRYSMKNGVLRVERDTPYIKSYSLDFLNMDRGSSSSVNLSTNVLSSGVSSGSSSGGGSSSGSSSSGGGGGGGGLNTGSTSSVTSTSTGDFWKSLDGGIQQILSYTPAEHVSETTMQAESDVNTIASSAANAPAAGASPNTLAAGSAAAANATPASAAASKKDANNTNIAAGITANKTSYTINRQAGVLTLDGTSKQHEMVQRLLDMLKKNASAQVLIEAKIIEVTLDEEYATGINWTTVGNNLMTKLGIGSISEAFPIVAPTGSTGGQGISFVSSANSNNLIQMIEQFGAVRTLSSPRLHAINNQQSTLTFAENKVYFTVSVNTTTNLSTATTTTGAVQNVTVNSTANTVPIGIMMTMMPSIDLDNNEVTLAVRPTLSTIIDSVEDPGVAIAAKNAGLTGIENLIPEIQVRELDSTLKLKSGQTMVIGGLMQQTANNSDTGVPFLAGVPVIGNAFKNVSKSSKNTELVLLIKATIVNNNGSLNNVDRNIFHKFSDDPRPVSF